MGVLDTIPNKMGIGGILNHRNLFFLGIALVLCGLPWSNVLMSIGQFVLVGNWILEGNFREKFERLWSNKPACLIIAFFFLHLLGLIWSSDLEYAFKDVRIKLVLIVIPFVLASSRPLTRQQFRLLIQFFVLCVFVVSLFSFSKYFGWMGKAVMDKRELSIRISHIRFGLMIAFATFCCLYLAYKDKAHSLVYIALAIHFLLALVLFQFYSGLFVFYIISCGFLFILLFHREQSIFTKLFAVLLLLLMISTPALVFYGVYSEFQSIPKKFSYDQEALDSKTEAGNPYSHHFELPYKENGYYVWRFINYDELRQEWNKRSELAFDSTDLREQSLHNTLIRYMTSMGLKKDSVGISKLRQKDVQAIENGVANVYLIENNKIKGRIHSTLYEIKNYRKHQIAEGFSAAMRMEYWKIALDIIKTQPILGVGTGDIQSVFNEHYQSENSLLKNKEYWRRSHNQFLSTWVQLGIPGLLLLLLVLFLPLGQTCNRTNFLFVVFIALISLSMLTEDTLETQAGASLFSIFYSLFLFNPKS